MKPIDSTTKARSTSSALYKCVTYSKIAEIVISLHPVSESASDLWALSQDIKKANGPKGPSFVMLFLLSSSSSAFAAAFASTL